MFSPNLIARYLFIQYFSLTFLVNGLFAGRTRSKGIIRRSLTLWPFMLKCLPVGVLSTWFSTLITYIIYKNDNKIYSDSFIAHAKLSWVLRLQKRIKTWPITSLSLKSKMNSKQMLVPRSSYICWISVRKLSVSKMCQKTILNMS